MVTFSHDTSLSTKRANIAHGVWPPLTANVNRPWPAIAAAACPATYSAALPATASASGQTSIRSAIAPLHSLLLGVSAELLAHRGQQLVGEQVQAARPEPRIPRRRQGRCRNAHLDRGDRRPAPLARIGHPARELFEVGGGEQRVGRQVEQPRP